MRGSCRDVGVARRVAGIGANVAIGGWGFPSTGRRGPWVPSALLRAARPVQGACRAHCVLIISQPMQICTSCVFFPENLHSYMKHSGQCW